MPRGGVGSQSPKARSLLYIYIYSIVPVGFQGVQREAEGQKFSNQVNHHRAC